MLGDGLTQQKGQLEHTLRWGTSIGTVYEVQISRGFAYAQLVGWGALGALATIPYHSPLGLARGSRVPLLTCGSQSDERGRLFWKPTSSGEAPTWRRILTDRPYGDLFEDGANRSQMVSA
jgi:hypothetical protein